MKDRNFFAELKRRNVYKVVVAALTLRGEVDEPFEWLQISFHHHDAGALSLLMDPLLRGLRDDPRYKNLFARPGLSTLL